MNVPELITRQSALLAELEQIEARLNYFFGGNPIYFATADEHGVTVRENYYTTEDLPRFIAWLQSLVGEAKSVEPKPWPVWCCDAAGAWQTQGISYGSGVSAVFRAPNAKCANEFAMQTRGRDYYDFAAKWQRDGEEVQA